METQEQKDDRMAWELFPDIQKPQRPKYNEFDEDCVCGRPTGQNAECERCRLIKRLMSAESLMWSLARHVRNTDKNSLVDWGIRSVDLLIEVRDYAPDKYEHRVKF